MEENSTFFKEQNKEILCEQNGELIPGGGGKCGKEELCTGPHHRDYADCGKAKLCEPSKLHKIENAICSLNGLFILNVTSSNEENYFSTYIVSRIML